MRSGSRPIPASLPDRLNIHKPPHIGNVESYQRLLDLLLELEETKRNQISAAAMRGWEARARAHLEPQEIDLLFMRPEDDAFSTSALPEERYLNLRKILLRRKASRPERTAAHHPSLADEAAILCCRHKNQSASITGTGTSNLIAP